MNKTKQISTHGFLYDEASTAHELLPQLFPALVWNVISRNHEPLPRGHVISNLVHFSVDQPPLRLLVDLPHCPARWLRPPPGVLRWTGIGPREPELENYGTKTRVRVRESPWEMEHGEGWGYSRITLKTAIKESNNLPGKWLVHRLWGRNGDP